MAKGLSGILDLLKLSDDDDYDDDFYEEEEIDEREAERLLRKEEKRLAREEKKAARRNPVIEEEAYEEEIPPTPVTPPKRTSFRTSSNKVVPIGRTAKGLEVCICKPKNFGDSQEACEMLLEGHAVVLNLEGIDIMEAQRIMDFITGCIFAISGELHPISRYIFIFSPENIDISGDYLELQEDDFVPTLNKEF